MHAAATTADIVLSWSTTLLMVVTIISFVAYLVSLRRLPTGERPSVPTYDRHGRKIGDYPNPGPDIAPGRPGDPLTKRIGAGASVSRPARRTGA